MADDLSTGNKEVLLVIGAYIETVTVAIRIAYQFAFPFAYPDKTL